MSSLISVVVPTYNSISKMGETLESLRELSTLVGAEVIFVDDCSRDNTYDELNRVCAENDSWRVLKLPSNSGSAAAPRNRGLDEASGRYVFFLDSDDVLIPANLVEAVRVADKYGYDVVRTTLNVRYGDGTEKVADNIPRWDSINDPLERKRLIVQKQSLTCSFVARLDLLRQLNIRFDEARRIGEDIKFTASVLASTNKIGFRSRPVRTYVRSSAGAESVTQKLSSSNFEDFIKSWLDVEERLADSGISFIREHGFAAIQYALRQFVWFKSEHLTVNAFARFRDFCRRFRADLRSFKFTSRYREIVDAAIAGDKSRFDEAVRLRVVFAGHDLKFVRDIGEQLRKNYSVRYDQWQGHIQHDEGVSKELLNWADFVWAEWMLGNAVWYSRHLRGDQRMVIRAHRSEMTASYGLDIDFSRVSAVVCIAPHSRLDFIDRFDIPAEKVKVIPNLIQGGQYRRGEYTAERQRRIGMVGILPKLKGFDKALKVLARLQDEEPQTRLWVYGKRPEELKWLMDKPEEREYFEHCDRLISDLGLQQSVVFKGWVDTKESLCEVGTVVSFSSFEGMQVSVAEGFYSGGLGLTLNWRGAAQGFPKSCVFDTVEEMTDALRSVVRGDIDLNEKSSELCETLDTLYSESIVMPLVNDLIRSVRA